MSPIASADWSNPVCVVADSIPVYRSTLAYAARYSSPNTGSFPTLKIDILVTHTHRLYGVIATDEGFLFCEVLVAICAGATEKFMFL